MLRLFRRPPRPTVPDDGATPVVQTVPQDTRGAVRHRLPSLASATRDYAQAVEGQRFDRLDAIDLARLSGAMGADLWAWQRARRLTGQTPWRASSVQAERYERARAARQMIDDPTTWERALVELDADQRRAILYGRPLPPALDIPPAVMLLIEARRSAALEKVTRRRRRAEDGDGGKRPCPEAAMHHPPSPT